MLLIIAEFLHHVRQATTLLNDKESARDDHVLACNFAKYLPILKQKFRRQTRQ